MLPDGRIPIIERQQDQPNTKALGNVILHSPFTICMLSRGFEVAFYLQHIFQKWEYSFKI